MILSWQVFRVFLTRLDNLLLVVAEDKHLQILYASASTLRISQNRIWFDITIYLEDRIICVEKYVLCFI